jgi:hypothetical protein
MGQDTADCIAHEMMEDLSLSAEEAEVIAEKIRLEIGRIAGEYVGSHGDDAPGGGAGGAGGGEGEADTAGSDSLSRLGAVGRDAIANAAAAAVVAVASAAAAANTGSGGGALPPLGRSGVPRASAGAPAPTAQGGGGGNGGGKGLVAGPGRMPSYHDIVRTMQEFNAQQLAAAADGDGPPGPASGGGAGAGSGGGAPVEVVLPPGHALDASTLARVASAAASAAAQQLVEAQALSPPRNGQYACVASPPAVTAHAPQQQQPHRQQ